MAACNRHCFFSSETALALIRERTREREAFIAALDRHRAFVDERTGERIFKRHFAVGFVREAGEVRIRRGDDAGVRTGRFNRQIASRDRARVFERIGRDRILSDRPFARNVGLASNVERTGARNGCTVSNRGVVEAERTVVRHAFGSVDRQVFAVRNRTFSHAELALVDRHVLELSRNRRALREDRVGCVDRHVFNCRKCACTLVGENTRKRDAVVFAGSAERQRAFVRKVARERILDGGRTGRFVRETRHVGGRRRERAGVLAGRFDREVFCRHRTGVHQGIGRDRVLRDRAFGRNIGLAGNVERTGSRHGTRARNGGVVEVERTFVLDAFRSVDRQVFARSDRTLGNLHVARIDRHVREGRFFGRVLDQMAACNRHGFFSSEAALALIRKRTLEREAFIAALDRHRAFVDKRTSERILKRHFAVGFVRKAGEVRIRRGDDAGVRAGRFNRQVVRVDQACVRERAGFNRALKH